MKICFSNVSRLQCVASCELPRISAVAKMAEFIEMRALKMCSWHSCTNGVTVLISGHKKLRKSCLLPSNSSAQTSNSCQTAVHKFALGSKVELQKYYKYVKSPSVTPFVQSSACGATSKGGDSTKNS